MTQVNPNDFRHAGDLTPVLTEISDRLQSLIEIAGVMLRDAKLQPAIVMKFLDMTQLSLRDLDETNRSIKALIGPLGPDGKGERQLAISTCYGCKSKGTVSYIRWLTAARPDNRGHHRRIAVNPWPVRVWVGSVPPKPNQSANLLRLFTLLGETVTGFRTPINDKDTFELWGYEYHAESKLCVAPDKIKPYDARRQDD